jgi:hypothetical protein
MLLQNIGNYCIYLNIRHNFFPNSLCEILGGGYLIITCKYTRPIYVLSRKHKIKNGVQLSIY